MWDKMFCENYLRCSSVGVWMAHQPSTWYEIHCIKAYSISPGWFVKKCTIKYMFWLNDKYFQVFMVNFPGILLSDGS